MKKKLDSNQKFVNKPSRSRTNRAQTTGTLGRFNNALEDDNSETIIAYRVEEGPGQSESRTDPVYYISNDLRLEKLQVPNLNNLDPPSPQQSRNKSKNQLILKIIMYKSVLFYFYLISSTASRAVYS